MCFSYRVLFFFSYVAKVAIINRKQKLWGKNLWFIVLCFLATLFFLGSFMAIWNEGQALLQYNRPFRHPCTEGHFIFLKMPSVCTYGGPVQEVIMTAWFGTHLIYPALTTPPNKINCWEDSWGAKTDSLRQDYKLVGDSVMNFFCKKIVCHVRDYGDTIVASQKLGETQK
jgi:hypothetical protein